MLTLIGTLSACASRPPAADETSVPPADTTADLSSGVVQYLDSGGGGVPVLLLHPNNIHLWQNQIPALRAAGYRVIAIDYRNRRSGGINTASAASNVERVDELVTRLRLPKFHIIGTGSGAVVSMQYGLAHPDRVRTVTVTNSLGGLRDANVNALELSLRPAPFNQLPQDFRELSSSYRAATPQGVRQWLEMEREGRDAVSTQPANISGTAPPEPSPYEVTFAKLASWRVPTLLITGDADLYTPPSVMRLFIEHLRNGVGAVIPESGHNAYWEHPAAFNRAVLSFIRRN
jgi:pimeloyl-ACP methyl ester carboxylesterase